MTDDRKLQENFNSRFIALVTVVAALGGLLFGYDTAVIAGAIGFLQSHFQLDPAMKGWAAASALLGCVIGVSFAGIFSDRMGRKKTLVLSGVLFLASAIGTAVPNEFWLFVLFRMLGGIGVGVASMASPMYIAEITPAHIRGRMVSVNQFAIVTGMLIIYFVNYFIARGGDEVWNISTGWRWMFASGAIPSAIFLILLFLVPESPRWLIEKGLKEKARGILAQIGGSTYADSEARSIEATLDQEVESIGQLFRTGWRKVMILGIGLAVLQQVTGINVFMYYAPEIFKKLGSGADAALLQTIVVGAVNLAFTIVAIWTVDRLGRKPLMIIGSIGMGISLVAMGLAAQFSVVSLWVLLCILAYIACFALSVGPVTWVILSEIYPTRIRGRALSIATFFLWGANFIVSQTFPMMDENPALIAQFNHGFPFYIYAIFCVALVLLVWKAVPETKGHSLEEIEKFWNLPQSSTSSKG
ncbi:MAG: sugar porter family MFS transporter [Ignavibacteriales bacterium]|nr:sugar porter family MFS transporter [Ignavibacteriales bacterium]